MSKLKVEFIRKINEEPAEQKNGIHRVIVG
jgi:hypothetical protein